jgi:5-methylcytosine-specific restriction endonuclease McrA
MPITPANRPRYPKDWPAISRSIRDRSLGQCECVGECGLHHDHRCEERNGHPALWARGRVVLTVAHLDHDPTNWDPANLRAMGQRCHNRYDQPHRQANARRTRRGRRAAADFFEQGGTP